MADLVSAVLASSRPSDLTPDRWLVTLDPRWARATTWQRLARLIHVPDEFTEVVYVYTGLRSPARLSFRELPRREFEARFGGAALGTALEPGNLRQLFGTPPR
jgi:hypothetical protein